jgi:hypothetical protein
MNTKVTVLFYVILLLFLAMFTLSFNSVSREFGKTGLLCQKDSSCLRKGYVKLLGKYDVKEISRELEKNAGDCHNEAHILGEAAISSGIPFEKVVGSCGTSCNYGCIHGAFVKHFSGDPEMLNYPDKICSDLGGDGKSAISCSHALGHVFGEMYSSEPSLAFSSCRKLTAENLFMSCANGAVMHILIGTTGPPVINIKSTKDLLKFCSGLDQKFRNVCYGYLGYYGYEYFGRSEEDVCSYVPKEAKNLCVYSMGERAYPDFKDSPGDFLDLCKEYGEFAEDCIGGALEASTARNDGFFIQFCKIAEGEGPEACRSIR